MAPLRKKCVLLPLLPWVESHRYTPIAPNQDCRWWWYENVSRKAALALLLLGAVVVTLAGLSQHSGSSSGSSGGDEFFVCVQILVLCKT